MLYTVYYTKRLGLHFQSPAQVDLSEMDRIGEVEASDLEDLFRKMNVVDGNELPVTKFRCRSMCTGDIAVDSIGRAYFCAPIGWETVAHFFAPAMKRSTER